MKTKSPNNINNDKTKLRDYLYNIINNKQYNIFKKFILSICTLFVSLCTIDKFINKYEYKLEKANIYKKYEMLLIGTKNTMPKAEDEYKKYAYLIRDKIYKEHVKNICLTSSIGGGKSSVIETLCSIDKKISKNTVKISVMDIESYNNESGRNKTILNNNKKEYDIETSLIQQILHSRKYSKTPNAKFDRIISPSLWLRILSVPFVVTFVPYLIMNIMFYEFISSRSISEKILNYGILPVIFGVAITLFLFKLWTKIKKITIKDYCLEFQNNDSNNQSKSQQGVIWNRFLSELIYFLYKNKIKLIIIEDFDRLKDSMAMYLLSKLLELNTIINNSYITKNKEKRIAFLYAIRGGLINSSEANTKQFDSIIDIVPHVNYNTVSRIMLEEYDRIKYKGSEDNKEMDTHFVSAIARFLNNRRQIINVWNHYLSLRANMFYNTLEMNKQPDIKHKMLFLSVWRVLYPNDYEKAMNNSGILSIIVDKDNKNVIVEKLIIEMRNAIQLLDNDYNNKNIELQQSIFELTQQLKSQSLTNDDRQYKTNRLKQMEKVFDTMKKFHYKKQAEIKNDIDTINNMSLGVLLQKSFEYKINVDINATKYINDLKSKIMSTTYYASIDIIDKICNLLIFGLNYRIYNTKIFVFDDDWKNIILPKRSNLTEKDNDFIDIINRKEDDLEKLYNYKIWDIMTLVNELEENNFLTRHIINESLIMDISNIKTNNDYSFKFYNLRLVLLMSFNYLKDNNFFNASMIDGQYEEEKISKITNFLASIIDTSGIVLNYVIAHPHIEWKIKERLLGMLDERIKIPTLGWYTVANLDVESLEDINGYQDVLSRYEKIPKEYKDIDGSNKWQYIYNGLVHKYLLENNRVEWKWSNVRCAMIMNYFELNDSIIKFITDNAGINKTWPYNFSIFGDKTDSNDYLSSWDKSTQQYNHNEIYKGINIIYNNSACINNSENIENLYYTLKNKYENIRDKCKNEANSDNDELSATKKEFINFVLKEAICILENASVFSGAVQCRNYYDNNYSLWAEQLEITWVSLITKTWFSLYNKKSVADILFCELVSNYCKESKTKWIEEQDDWKRIIDSIDEKFHIAIEQDKNSSYRYFSDSNINNWNYIIKADKIININEVENVISKISTHNP